MMKKQRKLFCEAWLLAVAMALAACSSDNDGIAENIVTPETEGQTWTVIVEAEKSTDASVTRALSIENKKLYTLWDTSEKIYVVKPDGTVQSGNLSPETGNVQTSRLTSNNLEGEYAVNDVLTLRTPLSVISYTGQKGTLANVSEKFAFMEAEVRVTSVDTDNKILTFSNATFTHKQAFLKFTFTDGDGHALDIDELVISDEANDKLVQSVADDGTLTCGALTVIPDAAQSEFFVAMHNDNTAANTYTFTAMAGTKAYVGTKTVPATIVDGKYGSTTVTMEETYVVGTVIGADGNIYSNKNAAVAAGTTACAIIAYVGSATGENSYTHGLAIAMKDANNGGYCEWSTVNSGGNPSMYSTISGAIAAKESGLTLSSIGSGSRNSDNWPAFKAALSNNITAEDGISAQAPTSASAPTRTSTWFLPSIFQWNQIVNGLTGTKTTFTTENNPAFLASEVNQKIIAAGGTGLIAEGYWSSTQYDSNNHAWIFSFYRGNASYSSEAVVNGLVRAVVAF